MRKLKRFVIIVLVLALIAGSTYGGLYYFRNRGGAPVMVYPFGMVGMTEFWGDNRESYGPVSTDRIQTVFLSDTQSVTDILVEEGQEVSKGDVLMTFDTTLSHLELERKELAIKKLNMDLEDAYKRLKEIERMVPMSIPPTEPEKELKPLYDNCVSVSGDYQLFFDESHDGLSAGSAVICWIRNDVQITDDFLKDRVGRDVMRYHGFAYDEIEEPAIPTMPVQSGPIDIIIMTEPEELPTMMVETIGVAPPPVEEVVVVEPNTVPSNQQTVVEEFIQDGPSTTAGPGMGNSLQGSMIPQISIASTFNSPNGSEEVVPYLDWENVAPARRTQRDIIPYYAIFKVTSDNLSNGYNIAWMGIHVDSKGGFSFFDASGLPDYSLPTVVAPEEEETEPEIDYNGSGYTACEIAQMKNEQLKTIENLERQLKMEQTELKIMEREIGDGNIYAEVDGTVLTVLDEEDAKLSQQPIIKVSGGGGYYIQVTISELERENMAEGQEVSISDWESGMTYTGVITVIGDYPVSSESYNGMDNPNASTYPFTVFADESANLRADSYVSVMYAAADNQNGIYLEKPYLRSEQGSSVVYVQGEDGLLERRIVKTGKSVWGSYTEILDGLTEDDLVAFPYGKTVKPGAPTQEGDYNDLYGY